jgi:hypothetical protein
MKIRLTPNLRAGRRVSCCVVGVYLLLHSPQNFLSRGTYANVDTDNERVKLHVKFRRPRGLRHEPCSPARPLGL